MDFALEHGVHSFETNPASSTAKNWLRFKEPAQNDMEDLSDPKNHLASLIDFSFEESAKDEVPGPWV